MTLHYVYGATNFLQELDQFLSIRLSPYIPTIPTSLDICIYHHATLHLSDPFANEFTEKIWALPVGELDGNDTLGGEFNTVLVRDNWESDEFPWLLGIHGKSENNSFLAILLYIYSISLPFYLCLSSILTIFLCRFSSCSGAGDIHVANRVWSPRTARIH
jgi:hypothetical protein